MHASSTPSSNQLPSSKPSPDVAHGSVTSLMVGNSHDRPASPPATGARLNPSVAVAVGTSSPSATPVSGDGAGAGAPSRSVTPLPPTPLPSGPGHEYDPAGSLVHLLQAEEGEVEAPPLPISSPRRRPGEPPTFKMPRLQVETGLGRPRRPYPISSARFLCFEKPSGPTRLAITAAMGGSFLIGYNIAALNSTLRYINWEFEWCSRDGTERMLTSDPIGTDRSQPGAVDGPGFLPTTISSSDSRAARRQVSSVTPALWQTLDPGGQGKLPLDLIFNKTAAAVAGVWGSTDAQLDEDFDSIVRALRRIGSGGDSADDNNIRAGSYRSDKLTAGNTMEPIDASRQSYAREHSGLLPLYGGHLDDSRDPQRQGGMAEAAITSERLLSRVVSATDKSRVPSSVEGQDRAEEIWATIVPPGRATEFSESSVGHRAEGAVNKDNFPAFSLESRKGFRQDYPSLREVGENFWAGKPSVTHSVSAPRRSLVVVKSCDLATTFEATANAALFAGAMAGSLSCGCLLGQGRRRTLQIGIFTTILGLITQAFSSWIASLAWGRFLTGFGCGVLSVGVPTYLSEISPPHARGRYGAYHLLFVMVGVLVAPAVSLPLVFANPLPDDYTSVSDSPILFSKLWWRFCIILPLIPGAIALILYSTRFPWDTAHWSLLNDRVWEAKAMTQYVYQRVEILPQLEQILHEVELSKDAKEVGLTLYTAARRYRGLRRVIVLGPLLLALQQLGGVSVFISLSSSMFLQVGVKTPWAQVFTSITLVLPVVVVLIAIWLLDRYGRRNLFLLSAFGELVFLLPATITAWVVEDEASLPMKVTSILAAFGYLVCYSFGHGPVLWVYPFEVYPLEIKAAAQSLAVATNWAFAILATFAVPYFDSRGAFTMFSIVACANFFVAFAWLEETRGRKLEDSPFMGVREREELVGW